MEEYFGVYQIDNDGEMQDVVSILPSDYVFEYGLAPEAVVGMLLTPLGAGGKLEPANFTRNSVFVQFLHQFIARRTPESADLQEAVRVQESGFVYIIDSRTPTPDGGVPPEDIIGAFSVESGMIDVSSYVGNKERHQILSGNGFFRLDPILMEQLREELQDLAAR